MPIKIDIDGYRISGDWRNLTVVTLAIAKETTKSYNAGDTLERDPRYYGDMGSAVRSVICRMAAGGESETVDTLREYVARIEAAEARVRALVEPGEGGCFAVPTTPVTVAEPGAASDETPDGLPITEPNDDDSMNPERSY